MHALALSPSAQGSGAAGPLFEPSASLALDFLTWRYRVGTGGYSSPDFAGLPGLTVSRSSVGYAERLDGSLQLFQANTARITDKGLLVEESRTNLLVRSQEFDNASWVKTDVTVTPNDTTAPDGTLTADLLTEGSAGTASTAQSIAIAATTTTSVYLKRGTVTWVRLLVLDTAATANRGTVWFNLETGAVGTASNGGTNTATSGTISAVANGFYRLTLTTTFTGAVAAASASFMSASADSSLTRQSGATYHAWQADNQAASYILSPIPTTSSSATRGADSVTITGLSSALTAPYTMAVTASFPSLDGVDLRFASTTDGTTSNRLDVQRSSGNVAQFTLMSGGVTQSNSGSTNGVTGARRLKMAARVRATTFTGSVNGGLGSDVAHTPASSNQLMVGRSPVGVHANSYIERVLLMGDTSDAAFQALTQ